MNLAQINGGIIVNSVFKDSSLSEKNFTKHANLGSTCSENLYKNRRTTKSTENLYSRTLMRSSKVSVFK